MSPPGCGGQGTMRVAQERRPRRPIALSAPDAGGNRRASSPLGHERVREAVEIDIESRSPRRESGRSSGPPLLSLRTFRLVKAKWEGGNVCENPSRKRIQAD